MALKPVKYVEIDDQKGTLYSAGKQSLLIPVTFIRAIDSIFGRLVGKKGADILIYKIGKGLGREYVRTLGAILKKEQTKIFPKTKIQIACNAIFMESGWGQARIRKIDLEEQILEVEIYHSPSNEFLKKSEYDLERGILAGIYKEITNEEVYCRLLKEDKKKHEIILRVSKKIPKEIKKQENLVLVSRRELEKDITELKKLRKDLDKKVQERTKELRVAKDMAEKEKDKTLTIIQNFADGLMVLDVYQTIAMINPEAEKIIGLPKEKIERKKLNDLKGNPLFQKLINLILKNGSIKQVFRKDLNIKENVTVEVTSVPLTREGSKFGYLIIFHDITREKLVERMKTEFVSLAAHQLRTPLSAIKWAIRMLLDKDLGEISKEQEDFLKRIYKSNERMIHLINDLLNVTHIEEGRFLFERTPTQITETVSLVISNLKEKADRKNIKIIYRQPKNSPPLIKVDAEKIEIVITNLIDNAIDYTPKNGGVAITLSGDKKEIKFSVQDNGMGIPQNQQKRMFTKFFRGENVVKMETEGTGLGMFITKNIIEAHGGKIWFESQEGQGTTFHFTLPINK